jgi:hypothetical protein
MIFSYSALDGSQRSDTQPRGLAASEKYLGACLTVCMWARVHTGVCVCVCVCVREREREGGGEREREQLKKPQPSSQI